MRTLKKGELLQTVKLKYISQSNSMRWRAKKIEEVYAVELQSQSINQSIY